MVAWAFYFAGNAAAGFGSAYYHLKPDDERIIWDRLPVFVNSVCTIIFFYFYYFLILICCLMEYHILEHFYRCN
jgi:hypothetical protein